MERQSAGLEKIISRHKSDSLYPEYLKHSPNSIVSKQKFKNGQKIWTRHQKTICGRHIRIYRDGQCGQSLRPCWTTCHCDLWLWLFRDRQCRVLLRVQGSWRPHTSLVGATQDTVGRFLIKPHARWRHVPAFPLLAIDPRKSHADLCLDVYSSSIYIGPQTPPDSKTLQILLCPHKEILFGDVDAFPMNYAK